MHRNDETAARADRNFNLPSLFQYPEQKTIELIFYLTRAPATGVNWRPEAEPAFYGRFTGTRQGTPCRRPR
jgi:hypothetical protein